MDHRPHIVVVEDEATQRRLLVDYLSRQNFRVSGIDGGVALRKLVEREMPALVLLDVGLPGEDGFALARWLREKSARIGIVMGLRPLLKPWTAWWGSKPARTTT
jgi:DNA-binding response OmpR family regulator